MLTINGIKIKKRISMIKKNKIGEYYMTLQPTRNRECVTKKK